jgi:hypothetical protein
VLIRLKSALLVLVTRTWNGFKRAVKRAVGHAEFRKIVAEFFLEAGVLCFLFPVLDTIVQFGTHKVTLKMAIWSTAIAVGCLFLAGLFVPLKEG